MNSGLQAWQQCFYLLRYFIGLLDIHFFFKSCFYFVRNHFGVTSAAILAAAGS